MKRNVFVPLLLIVVFVLLVGSGCSLLGGNEAEPQEPQVIVITATPNVPAPVVTEAPAVVTEAPAVVATDVPAVVATEPPAEESTAPQGDMYFRDEFDNSLDNYSHFLFDFNQFRIFKNNEELEEKAGVELDNGRVKFNMEEYNLSYHFIYEPQTYEDVKVSMEVENLGYNASSAALVCRYDEDLGWYQLSVDFQGYWALYYYDALIEKGFTYLTNGGAAEFDYGKGKNTFTLVCEGDEISVYINDVFSQTFKDENLKSGKVGFAARTDNTYTIINVPWFEVSQP